MGNTDPLQINMFTGELADTRTARQKRLAKERELPKPLEMFSVHDIGGIGITTKVYFEVPDCAQLAMYAEDPRTEEEKERDRQKAAEDDTYPMFVEEETDGTED